jgi:hypothetical protein
MLLQSINQSEDIINTMNKTIGFAVVCSAVLFAGQIWAFGFNSSGPSSNNPNTGAGYYDQAPYGSGPRSGSGGGFGGGPNSRAPGYGSAPSAAPGAGYGGYGGEPRTPNQGPGYGGYQQAPGYAAPPQGYGYPQAPTGGSGGYAAPPQSQEEYDIPRDTYGNQYQPIPGYGGYPQAPAPGGYYGGPGYGYPPPGYPGDYYRGDRDRGDRNSGSFPNPMNMMKSPMKMFGGGSDRD